MIAMPVYRNFEWQDFKILIKPCGIRRVLPFLPYFTGSDINLSLSFETISGNQLEFAYYWKCFHAEANDNAQVIETGHATFLGNPQKKSTTIAKIGRLNYKGLYEIHVDISYPIENSNHSPSTCVVSFYACDRDAFTIKCLFALVGVVGIGIGCLISWFLR